jgi:predicted RND superfamily exporter protein
MDRMSERVAGWLISHRALLAIIALVAGVVGVERARQLEFSRSIDAMFDRSDPALLPYRRVARTFGSGEVLIVAYDDADLFTPAGIARLEGLTTRIAALPGIASATSLATTPLGRGVIDVDGNGTAARVVSLLEGYAVGADRRTAAVVCLLRPGAPQSPEGSRGATIDALRALVAELPEGTVAGEPVMLREGFAMLERDGNVLGTTSGLLAAAVLLVSFRSLRWLVTPLAVVLLALWTTRGALAVIGLRLTMVSTMLSAMVTVVAIATVVHLIVEFRRQRSLGLGAEPALHAAIATLAWPIAGAIATDCIGFGSLLVSRVGPVHDFGVMTALGAIMVLLASAAIIPFLALTGRFDADPKRAWGEQLLDLGLDRLVARIVRQPVAILAVTAVVVAVAVSGMRWLEVETDYIRNFRRSSPVVRSYDMVETRLGGAGVWDVLVPTTDPPDATTLVAVARLERRLRDEVTVPTADGGTTAGLTKVMSLADLLDTLSPVSLADLEKSRVGGWLVSGAVGLLRQREPKLCAALVGQDPEDGSHWLRVMLRARERQPAAAKREIIATVRRIVAEEFPGGTDRPAGEVTGFFVLLAQLVDRLLADQWRAFLVATAGILALLAVSFRSILLALVALVPNALPIFLVLGLLGWIGEPVNMGTAMIAAVSMGLSVDSSIHYIVAFRRRLAEDGAVAAALGVAHQTAGRAMIFSTLALVVGFLALLTSSFIPTVSFGALCCLTLTGGLLGNLVVLPVLLALVAPWVTTLCPAPRESLQLSKTLPPAPDPESPPPHARRTG